MQRADSNLDAFPAKWLDLALKRYVQTLLRPQREMRGRSQNPGLFVIFQIETHAARTIRLERTGASSNAPCLPGHSRAHEQRAKRARYRTRRCKGP